MTERERNDSLARAIREAGYSYAELARRVRAVAEETGSPVRTNSSAVAHWVAGTQPAEQTAALITEALSRSLGRPITPVHLGLRPAAASDGAAAPLTTGPASRDPLEDLVLLGRGDIERRAEVCRVPYSDAVARLSLDLDAQAAALTTARGAGVMRRQ